MLQEKHGRQLGQMQKPRMLLLPRVQGGAAAGVAARVCQQAGRRLWELLQSRSPLSLSLLACGTSTRRRCVGVQLRWGCCRSCFAAVRVCCALSVADCASRKLRCCLWLALGQAALHRTFAPVLTAGSQLPYVVPPWLASRKLLEVVPDCPCPHLAPVGQVRGLQELCGAVEHHLSGIWSMLRVQLRGAGLAIARSQALHQPQRPRHVTRVCIGRRVRLAMLPSAEMGQGPVRPIFNL